MENMKALVNELAKIPGIPVDLINRIHYETLFQANCAELPLVVGFSQTIEVEVGAGASESNQITIDTGHGDVFGYIVTPNTAVFADLYFAKLTLKNNNNTFALNEPMLNFSTLYQNGTDIRARGFRMKEQSTFQVAVDNLLSAVAIKVSVTLLFTQKGKKSQGLFE